MALPGVKTTILDRFYNQSRTDLPGGPLVTVIGKRGNTATAEAPDLTPYYATSEQDVIEQFGENSQIRQNVSQLMMTTHAADLKEICQENHLLDIGSNIREEEEL